MKNRNRFLIKNSLLERIKLYELLSNAYPKSLNFSPLFQLVFLVGYCQIINKLTAFNSDLEIVNFVRYVNFLFFKLMIMIILDATLVMEINYLQMYSKKR
jgi:hypothetical protein